MIKQEIGDLFNFISETNLTERDFYEHRGEYPVYSGKTEGEGVVACIDYYEQDEPCVTFTTYGKNAGTMFYRDGKYTIGRNCMGLRPKEEYEDKINLEWFSYAFQPLFYRLRIGDREGQRSLNKMLVRNVTVEIPAIGVQEEQLSKYKQVEQLINEVEEVKNSFNQLAEDTKFSVETDREAKVGNIFEFKGGKSLTEKIIYEHQPTSEEDIVPIYSGATEEENSLGEISKEAKEDVDELKLFNGPAILVVRKGLAGTMRYVEDEYFTTNDDVYVLKLKDEWEGEINLRWFSYQYQELFKQITSNGDNATFSKSYAKEQIIGILSKEKQDKIADKLEEIEALMDRLDTIKDDAEDLNHLKLV